MDVMYWTFPHLSGKWSISAGKKTTLQNGVMCLDVKWDDEFPFIGEGHDAIYGTRWRGDAAVQAGVLHRAPGSAEKSGGSVNYYQVDIEKPVTEGRPKYTAECQDIIEALDMNFSEGNVFKALWRSCAERTLGKKKAGGDAVYDAEKMVFFSNRILKNRKE